jgi:PAS domain S-box-containing protein
MTIADGSDNRADELRDNAATLRLLVDAVEDRAVFLLNPQGYVVTWNSGAEKLKQYTTDEILGKHFSYFYLPEDVATGKPQADLARAATEGRLETEGWRQRKDGTLFQAHVTLTPLYSGSGGLLGFGQVTRDLTHDISQAHARSVLDHVLDGIISIDEHGGIRSFNPAAEQIFGYSETEVLGRNVRMLMPEPYHSEHDRYIGNYLRTGEAKIIGIGREVSGLRQDGSLFPMSLAVSEFELGGKRYFTGIVRDLSQRRTLEEQLRQSQKMEAVGQLAGGVAHDFNNLLTIIIGYTDIVLAELPRDSEHREPLSTIRQSADRAALLTHQLLAFSRKQVMQAQLLNLNQIVKETEKMLRRLIGEDIAIVTALDPELFPVKLDPGQFMQVLVNLAVNSRDAMPQGGKLTIKTSNFYSDAERAAMMPEYRVGPYVQLSFSDDGCGIPAEARQHVFEPFFTTKPQGKGTGLGLATVYGIIKQSGGNIEVYSEEHYGTTFKIYLPAVVGADLTLAQEQATRVPSARGQETVLLVEDEPGVRLIALLVLESQGYYVLDAAGPEEALRLAADHQGRIDLLLTDVVMPGMNGRELAEEIVRQRADVKVLFMSGYTDDAVFSHGLLYRDVAFLQKPFTPTSLAQRVREVLDGNSNS